jgi:iron-sulfur cluster assembly protein
MPSVLSGLGKIPGKTGRGRRRYNYESLMVTLTDKAAGKVKELLNGQGPDEGGLRVAIRGGGCSGFQYALAFDEQREGDQVYEYQEIRLLIDAESLPFVDGSEVDYVEGLQGAGFAVNNPNVVAACGCGQSFRTT